MCGVHTPLEAKSDHRFGLRTNSFIKGKKKGYNEMERYQISPIGRKSDNMG